MSASRTYSTNIRTGMLMLHIFFLLGNRPDIGIGLLCSVFANIWGGCISDIRTGVDETLRALAKPA
jgi:hypothetical protein